jgi:hypothetical protein
MGKIPNPQRGQVQEFIVMGPDKVRHVPFINAVRKYNSEMGAKEYVQTPDVELFKQRITKVLSLYPDAHFPPAHISIPPLYPRSPTP